MQLFCFTFAGGTAAFFDQLERTCGAQIEFVKLEYSGHGSRHKEPLYHDFNEVAEDLCEIIQQKYDGGDYALLGYSMGSISATEVLKTILLRKNMPEPKHIFLAAHAPVVIVNLRGVDSKHLEEYVKERTIEFGGIPEKLIHNRSFWRMYLPLYTADYSLIVNYDFEHLQIKTGIPTTFFYSESDTPLSELQKWRKYFIGPCEFIEYSGNHFFIQEHYEEMAQVILSRLELLSNDI